MSYLISTDLRSKRANNDNKMAAQGSLTFTFDNIDVMQSYRVLTKTTQL